MPPVAGNVADLSAKGTVEVYLGDYDDKYLRISVGTYGPEISGIYDMSGNVSEWVHDYYSLEPPGTRIKCILIIRVRNMVKAGW